MKTHLSKSFGDRNMIKKKQITAKTIKRLEELPDLLESIGNVEFAYLFGSSAGTGPKPLSDIDIAVFLEESCNFSESRLEILGRINDLLETDEVDLIVLNTAPLSLVGRILSRKKLVFSRNDFLRHRFESLSLRKYFDFKLIEEKILRGRFRLGR